MKMPFETHKILITLDDHKIYKLHADFSKTELNNEEVLTEESLMKSRKMPFILMHKSQFDYGKTTLMNRDNPQRMCKETAMLYYRIGFIGKEELEEYLAD
ncbi:MULTISPECIES: hypothetical protein [unclassified Psychrobacillus]|uniref:hypothetical protein n=1 Tax=unclassified Psychrobacillus TaxID=2636677 RepID=UPI0030F99626